MKRLQRSPLSPRSSALLLLLACACTLLVAAACSRAPSSGEAEVWTCPMHPTCLLYTSDAADE